MPNCSGSKTISQLSESWDGYEASPRSSYVVPGDWSFVLTGQPVSSWAGGGALLYPGRNVLCCNLCVATTAHDYI